MKVSILKTLFWIVGIIAILVVVVWPLVSSALMRAGYFPDWLADTLGTTMWLQTLGMQAFAVCWVVFLGACFASFLNVVAWRVPRGRGVNGSSHCPNCDVRLRFRDNLPIIGWVRNSGRCRHCRQTISTRYLIVEIVLGLVTLLVVALEVFWCGFNLPGYAGQPFAMLGNLVVNPKFDLMQTAGLHLALVYSLFTMAVVRSERLAVPRVVWMTALAIVIGLVAVFPQAVVSPIYIWETSFDRFSANWLATVVCGASVGCGVGLLFDWAEVYSAPVVDVWERDQKLLAGEMGEAEKVAEAGQNFEVEEKFVSELVQEDVGIENSIRYPTVVSIGEGVAVFSLIGLCLGWLAALMVGAMLLLVFWPMRLVCKLDFCAPLAIQGLVATVAFICGWRFLTVWSALL